MRLLVYFSICLDKQKHTHTHVHASIGPVSGKLIDKFQIDFSIKSNIFLIAKNQMCMCAVLTTTFFLAAIIVWDVSVEAVECMKRHRFEF